MKHKRIPLGYFLLLFLSFVLRFDFANNSRKSDHSSEISEINPSLFFLSFFHYFFSFFLRVIDSNVKIHFHHFKSVALFHISGCLSFLFSIFCCLCISSFRINSLENPRIPRSALFCTVRHSNLPVCLRRTSLMFPTLYLFNSSLTI